MLKWHLQLIILALATVLSAPARALNIDRTFTQYRLDVWGMRDGLPGYDITSLAQTNDGFLWGGAAVTWQSKLQPTADFFENNKVP